jgi:hypothetical protein
MKELKGCRSIIYTFIKKRRVVLNANILPIYCTEIIEFGAIDHVRGGSSLLK